LVGGSNIERPPGKSYRHESRLNVCAGFTTWNTEGLLGILLSFREKLENSRVGAGLPACHESYATERDLTLHRHKLKNIYVIS
jgi:hypothetical protein